MPLRHHALPRYNTSLLAQNESLAPEGKYMSRRKRVTKKQLVGKARTADAIRWLRRLQKHKPTSIVEAYSRRYAVNTVVAREDLISLGYYAEILIQEYENEGVQWEYRVEPLSGEMIVVPVGTEEHELYEDYYTV